MGAWRTTRFTERLGLDYPIVQGPFGGGISSAALAAAVSNAGGLGSYGAHVLSGAEIRSLVVELRLLTSRPFNINLWVPLPGEEALTLTSAEFAAEEERVRPLRERLGMPRVASPGDAPGSYAAQSFNEQLEAVIEARPPVASFVFGAPPAAAIAEMKRRDIVTIGTATTVDEAIALEAAGMDLIVATGSDAGGHRVSFLRPAEHSLVGTFSLVPQVVDAVSVPVIAAGGIADGRGVIAALTLGASAVQVGTAFLACDEAGASDAHKEALTGPDARWTALTRVFTGRLARGLRNRAMIELEAAGEASPYPARPWFMSPINQAAAVSGRADAMALWAGQAASFARRRSAAECFAALIEGAERAGGG